jgi:LmbE family N-acetylglucosaminyl deacetylase
LANNRYQPWGPYYPSFPQAHNPWWIPNTINKIISRRKDSGHPGSFRKSKSGKKYNKLMIVAHPDDETIFGGAQLLKSSRWKVICVTNGEHPIRRREFKKAMNKVGAKWEIWNYTDDRNGGFNKKRLKADLKRAMFKKRIKMVVTHNPIGEYGHSQHKALSKVVHKLVKKNLYVFHLSNERLKKRMLKKKKRLLKCYRSQKTIIRKLKYYVKHEAIKKVK